MNDAEALTEFLERKARSRPIAGILLSRSDDVSDGVDSWTHEDLTGARWHEVAREILASAERQAKASKSSASYYVWLEREGSERPCESFPLVFEASPRHGSMVATEHQALEVTSGAMVDMHRVMLEHTRTAIHRDQGEKSFLFGAWQAAMMQAAQANSERFADMDRLRAIIMAEEERKDREYTRKRNDALFAAGIRQLEVVLPLIASYVMKGHGAGDNARDVEVLNLVLRFSKSLSEEQSSRFVGILNPVQMIAFAELASGKLTPTLVPITVARVMSQMTKDQHDEVILRILNQATVAEGETIPSEQQAMWIALTKLQQISMLEQVEKTLGVKLLRGES
jgi:hypothetical protein